MKEQYSKLAYSCFCKNVSCSSFLNCQKTCQQMLCPHIIMTATLRCIFCQFQRLGRQF